MGELNSDSKTYTPNPNKWERYQEFLCLVANGAARSKVAGVRRRFIRLYNDWFPPFDPYELPMHKSYYREVIDWWNVKGTELPVEEPDERFGLYIVILRRKLRVIWLLVCSGAEEEAVHRIEQLSTHYYRYYYMGSVHHNCEEQRKKMFEACNWLKRNVGKLKVCENPQCQEMTKYFVRRWNNHKYCTETCCAEVNAVRRHARSEASPPKVYIRSDEAREKMKQSAKERWRRHRIERGLKHGERGTRPQK
jgi:hypothetical protein